MMVKKRVYFQFKVILSFNEYDLPMSQVADTRQSPME